MQAPMKRSIMHAMEESALFISALALIVTVLLAGFGMLFQWLISQDTRQQATEIRKDVAEFKVEVSSLLGEIRGLTTETRQSQERQMDTMIHAFISRTTEATSTGTANIDKRIDAIQAALGDQQISDQVRAELGELRSAVESLKYSIPTAAHSAAALGLGRIKYVTVTPVTVSPGASVEILVGYDAPQQVEYILTCVVNSPSAARYIKVVKGPFAPGEWLFRFPQEFWGAKLEAHGQYEVVAQLHLPEPGGLLDTAASSFLCMEREGQSPPAQD